MVATQVNARVAASQLIWIFADFRWVRLKEVLCPARKSGPAFV